jgi:hypothetical protein
MKYAGEKVVRGLRLHQQSTKNQQTCTIDPTQFAEIDTGEFIPENTVARALYGHVLLTQQIVDGVQLVEIDQIPIPKEITVS